MIILIIFWFLICRFKAKKHLQRGINQIESLYFGTLKCLHLARLKRDRIQYNGVT